MKFPKRYVSGLSKEILYDHLGQVALKLETVKDRGRKKVETFWVRGYFSVSYYNELLLFGRPGFESRTMQTLRLYSFTALWSIRTHSISFESPITLLIGARIPRS